jgi:hypothetical protein
LQPSDEPGVEAEEPSPFSEALSAEGIEHKAVPKAEEAEEAAPEESSEDTYAQDSTDALAAALKPAADKRQADAEALRAEALELGYTEAEAKVLAHNTSRKEARNILDSKREKLQSGRVAQSAPSPEAPPSAGAARDALAEVASRLSGSLGDEDARAVAEALSPVFAELESLRAQVQGINGVFQERQVQDARSQVLSAAGELSGQFPALLRGQNIDPAVAAVALPLLSDEASPFHGRPREALEAACRAAYGSVASPRQAPTTAKGRDTSAPSPLGVSSTVPIHGHQVAERIAEISRKYANDPAKADAEVSRLVKSVREHNARVKVG